MVKVIYEGKPTTFRAICSNCHSLLEFTKEDFTDSYGKKTTESIILCPICDKYISLYTGDYYEV